MAATLKRRLSQRARGACEYCRIPQAYFPFPFSVDHIIAIKHGGKGDTRNLAWACLHCNAHKGTDLSGIDQLTKRVVRLFNPRRHQWVRHFRIDGMLIKGKTPIGRATVRVLKMNDDYMVGLRAELIDEGLFPPD